MNLTTKPPIHPFAKWVFALSFLFTFAVGAAGLWAAHLFFKTKSFEPMTVFNPPNHTFAGSIGIDEKVQILAASGLHTFRTSKDDEFKWHCQDASGDVDPKTMGSTTIFDMMMINGASCEFDVPAGKTLIVSLSSGRLVFDEPLFKVSASVDRGDVQVTPSPIAKYKTSMKVDAGAAAAFGSSDSADAIELNVHVKSGAIEKGS